MASFRNIYTSLVLLIARATEKDVARHVSYLKAENQILRSRLPQRLILTQREKSRFVRFAKNLGSALNELATIVHPLKTGEKKTERSFCTERLMIRPIFTHDIPDENSSSQITPPPR